VGLVTVRIGSKEVDAMIQVTESAADLLATLDRPAGRVVRLEQIDEQRLGLVLGEAREGDQVVEREGQDLLHIPAEISAALDGVVIDKTDTPSGPRLRFRTQADEEEPGPDGTAL
jgi:hypothetical protein